MIPCSLLMHVLNQIFEALNEQISEAENIIQNIFQMYLNTNSRFFRFQRNSVTEIFGSRELTALEDQCNS